MSEGSSCHENLLDGISSLGLSLIQLGGGRGVQERDVTPDAARRPPPPFRRTPFLLSALLRLLIAPRRALRGKRVLAKDLRGTDVQERIPKQSRPFLIQGKSSVIS